jgi:hypothetical protein
MKESHKIQKCLISWVRGSSEVILPNFYYHNHECDVFRLTGSDFVIEYEIKISRSDFFADFKKGWSDKGEKHLQLKSGEERCPNRFFFVVPDGLVKPEEVPAYAGLIYFKGNYCEIVKAGKLIHRKKFTNHRMICITVSAREAFIRAKYNALRNFDAEEEISKLKKQYEAMRKQSQEDGWELLRLRRHVAKSTSE